MYVVFLLRLYFEVIQFVLCCVLFFKCTLVRTCSKCPPSATVHSQERRQTERYTVWIVANGTYLSSAPTFQHILHLSIDFKLVSDSCYCYPWWWYTKLNPPMSLNFNNILNYPISFQNHLCLLNDNFTATFV